MFRVQLILMPQATCFLSVKASDIHHAKQISHDLLMMDMVDYKFNDLRHTKYVQFAVIQEYDIENNKWKDVIGNT